MFPQQAAPTLGRAAPGFVCEWLRHFIANKTLRVTPLNEVLYILMDINKLREEMGLEGEPPSPGETIYLSGGYFHEPQWLQDSPEGCQASVLKYIPGQNETNALVVKLEEAISHGGKICSFMVLENRYHGVVWQERGVVHIELCDFEPEEVEWSKRPQGTWVESAATYKVVRDV